MKGPISVIPSKLDAGPATAAVRSILIDWAAIDWFVPPGGPGQHAQELFAKHCTAAHRHTPTLYSEAVDLEFSSGRWEDFFAMCSRVRSASAFDWKYRVLKILSRDHAQSCGWSSQTEASMLQKEPDGSDTLIHRVGNHVFWCSPVPKLDLAALSKEHAESAQFYLSYASIDAIDAVQWQLADPRSPLAENPFMPLLRCYAAGFYPFMISATSVIMFSFHGPS